eukprot:scpid46705/ scgid18446/ Dol-P-Man:Man(5)GlcNAc(2)-PP-Dol alpha-1,3-mannosyltransferase; Alpha-1,3-mannosyltransferase ALG3; Asparagine-linked glycosylation protein 3; Not56-like protein
MGWRSGLESALALLNSESGRCLFVLVELLLNVMFIHHGPFHAIDWKAYMDQIEMIEAGEHDYMKIKGRTGPLVYPGGHVWLHWLLYWLTGGGKAILLCQALFLVVQVLTSTFVTSLYWRYVPQPFVTCCMFLFTVRCRNVYVNGLFNDCWAMLFVYMAMWLAVRHSRWTLGLLAYSTAVSIKMSALLFAPGMAAAAFCAAGSFSKLVRWSVPAAVLQILAGGVFLIKHPLSYVHRSFELDRQFFHFLSHNFKWLPKDIFFSRAFQISLLTFHVGLLVFLCAHRRWLSTRPSDKQALLAIIFVSNFVGICFCRSLHYSFYSWYFHTLPFLVSYAGWPWLMRYAYLIIVELCWNVWTPYRGDNQDGTCASPKASLVLTCCHAVLLMSILLRR